MGVDPFIVIVQGHWESTAFLDFVDDTSSFPYFSMWTSQEAYLPAAFHTQKGFKKVINSLHTPTTNGTNQVAMVLALGLMI